MTALHGAAAVAVIAAILAPALARPGAAQALRSDRYAAPVATRAGDGGAAPWSPLWFPGAAGWRWGAHPLREPAATPGGLAFELGNPAALALELDAPAARFAAGSAGEAGGFRSPAEPGKVEVFRLAGSGWRPLAAGGVAGGAEVEQATLRAPMLATMPGAGSGTPVASFDTAASALRELSARIHGVGGWRVGPISVGIGAGVLGTERRTIRAPTPRRVRGATTAGVAGLAWRPGASPLRFGLHARRARSAETALIHTVAAGTRVYHVWGLGEASPLDLSTLYYRRLDRDAWSLGAGAAGRTLRLDWVAGFESGAEEGRQSSVARNDPPADVWSARVNRALLRVRWPDWRGHDRLVAGVEWEAVAGDVTGFEADSAEFRFEAMRIATGASLRMPLSGPWEATLTFGFDIYDEHRGDERVGVASDLNVWRPGAQVRLARAAPAWGAALRGWTHALAPTGALPDPSALGPTYRAYVAPELALIATETHGFGVGAHAWLRWRHGVLWAAAARSSQVPEPGVRLPAVPTGERTAYHLTLGIDLVHPDGAARDDGRTPNSNSSGR